MPALIKMKNKVNKITKLAFKQRLTQEERISLRSSSDPIIQDFMDLVSDAQYIDLSRKDTIQGIQYLEQAGLLSEGRANEILNNPISPDERFNG